MPLEWHDNRNILWKTPLPGRGASSPILWQDSIYLTAYTGYGLEKDQTDTDPSRLVRKLICVNRLDGRLRWTADVPQGESPEHPISSYVLLHGYASSTPVADETGVYFYLGRAGVFAYDHSGKRRWHAPLGDRSHNWGSAASPILYENLLIVHADLESHSLLAFDKATGRKVWSVHTGAGDSWSTPLL
ncbi:MAG: PQQ-binding-like beta-propeller repeat protein, partial [Verrucomicrobiota bacterium]